MFPLRSAVMSSVLDGNGNGSDCDASVGFGHQRALILVSSQPQTMIKAFIFQETLHRAAVMMLLSLEAAAAPLGLISSSPRPPGLRTGSCGCEAAALI